MGVPGERATAGVRAGSEFPAGLICGVPVQAAHIEEFAAGILQTIQAARESDRRGAPPAPAYVATINSDFLANTRTGDADRRARLLATLRAARFSTADGMPVVWLLRATGLSVPERVTGADLFEQVVRGLPRGDARVFVLGGDRRSFRRAAKKMHTWTRGLQMHGAFPRLNDDGQLIDEGNGATWDELRVRRFFRDLNRRRPTVLCLALGNPRQELFFERYRHMIRVPIVMGLGGTINFIAGRVRRAPAWLGRLGLEWAFRLAMEPRRLAQRYLRDALHLLQSGGPLLVLHALQRLYSAGRRGATPRYFDWHSRPELADATAHATHPRAAGRPASDAVAPLQLDLSGIKGSDARGFELIRRCTRDAQIRVHGSRSCGLLLRLALRIHQIETGAEP